ncbi:MAG: 5-formyltetrahydrofolate cyclo-ligase [Bacteroidales bacterium]|jgi:5-formyltetrahydrofolate cyclo-ligase|nr:5-formyltetrahydrofolate cyclo-ligase [Bacteroidales bacterium]
MLEQNNLTKDLKTELRKRIRQLKREIPLEEKIRRSASIWPKVMALDAMKNARTILMYWSMDDEVYTHTAVLDLAKEKTVLLPAVDGDNLRIKQFRGMDKMQAGEQFGIGEPVGDDFSGNIDVIIVPGVAFDRQRNRMGRGRGFYDRLLRLQNATKIGVAFDFQLLDHIPAEPFDIKMDRVVTESSEF